MRKTTKKKIAPIAITVLLVAYLTPLIAIVLALAGFLGARDGLPALPFLLGYAFLGGAVVVGVILALAGERQYRGWELVDSERQYVEQSGWHFYLTMRRKC